MRIQILNCKIEIHEGSSTTKIDQKIYSERKSSNSPRNFGFERTREINFRTLSEDFKTI